jgi:hypothetical protein
MKIEGSESGSESISQRHGSADPDPDPHQNVMDPQHCYLQWLIFHQEPRYLEPSPRAWITLRLHRAERGGGVG